MVWQGMNGLDGMSSERLAGNQNWLTGHKMSPSEYKKSTKVLLVQKFGAPVTVEFLVVYSEVYMNQ